jgi:hypothetical protein
MLWLAIDLPELLLHELDFNFMLANIVEAEVTNFYSHYEANKSEDVGAKYCRFVDFG